MSGQYHSDSGLILSQSAFFLSAAFVYPHDIQTIQAFESDRGCDNRNPHTLRTNCYNKCLQLSIHVFHKSIATRCSITPTSGMLRHRNGRKTVHKDVWPSSNRFSSKTWPLVAWGGCLPYLQPWPSCIQWYQVAPSPA